MTIMSGAAGASAAKAATAAAAFSPTIYGRVEASGYVALGDDYTFNLGAPGPTASCDVGIWVIQTVDNCYIRVGINDSPNTVNTWYNTGGASQGAPGLISSTGATVFELGEQCDTVTIDHTDNTVASSPTFATVSSSYTDNSAFAPTQDAKYGRQVQVADISSQSPTPTEGYVSFDVTFVKAGLDNYNITYRVYATALAEWEP